MNLENIVASKHKDTLLKHDKIVFLIILAHLPVLIFLIPMGYDTQSFALISSVLVGMAAGVLYSLARGTRLFGILAGILLMTLSAIMIQTQFGRIEMHFHIFGALALMLIYRDWMTIVAAAAAIAVHHLLFTALQLNAAQLGDMQIMVFNYGCNWGITFLHAAFVVFESAILVYYSIIMKNEEVTGLQLIAAVSEVERNNSLSVRLPEDESNTVTCAFNKMMIQFDQLISSLRNTSINLASTSHDLNNSSKDTSVNMETQNDQIAQAVTAMSEMSKTIHDIAKNSQLAAASANSADDEAQKGSNLVSNVAIKSKELLGSMDSASNAMQSLEQNVDNIGSVVDVIRGISEQTNLLALNAAIEAARAGDQGRGFAVVADEVRTLAQRTQESTAEIQDIIESLQSVTGKAVESINLGQERTSTTSEEITEAGTMLKSIVESVSKINSMNVQIATAAEEQASVADSISDNIESISNLSQNTLTEVEQNLKAAQELNVMSEDLKQGVNKYQ